MQAHERLALLLIWPAAVAIAGCSVTQQPVAVTPEPDPITQESQQGNVPTRFQETTKEGPTAVESAIELSKKYAKLAEEMTLLQKENQSLSTRSQQLNEQLVVCQTQLKQTQKELTEANDLLIEMRIELNNWRTDILGFRDEMREADKAELEALLKILQVLGGEFTEEPIGTDKAGLSEKPLSEPNQPAQQSAERGKTDE